MLDRDEDMLITGGRHPFYGKYKVWGIVLLSVLAVAAMILMAVILIFEGNFTDPFLLLQVGFLNSGRVVALDVTYYGNAGNSMDLSQAVSIIMNHRPYSSNYMVCW